MARATKRLSARSVATIGKPGRHADGEGLYLVVDPGGARRWLFLFRWQGKLKEMGLGGISSVSLAEARDKAAEARRVVAGGRNPIEERRAAAAARAEVVTFGSFADALIDSIGSGFRNEKHLAQWRSTMSSYAAPLRGRALDEIGTEDILSVLTPIWKTKAETASRVRGRIERVLDAARAKGLRTGENPARWRGHLDHLLPKRQKLTRGHHAAMPFVEVPAFIVTLRERQAVAALALEFLILNASRSGEALGAVWGEIDRSAGVWTIPAPRMKAGIEHRVPLTPRALEILASAEAIRTSDYVFPGQRRGRPLSGMAMEMMLRRMEVDFTVHGFRSSFRDWAGERTAFPREVAEAALAHAVGDQTERAYRRGDALEKRRKLMEAWAEFLERPNSGSSANVVGLAQRRPA
jgi:integrase